MTEMIDLLEVTTQADLLHLPSDRPSVSFIPRECDGCGEVWPDVDLWAMDPETGEEICLCLSCGG